MTRGFDDPLIGKGIIDLVDRRIKAVLAERLPVKRYGILAAIASDGTGTVKFPTSAELSPGWALSGKVPLIGSQVRCWTWPGEDGDRYIEGAVDSDSPPPFVGARVTRTTNQSINDVTNTDVLFTTDLFDALDMHDVNANTDAVAIPAGFDGKWLIIGWAKFAANAAGSRQVVVTIDGADPTTMFGGHNAKAADSGEHRGVATLLDDLTAGQIIRLSVRQSSGGALNVAAASLTLWRIAE